jgi:hypothetical protein
MVMQQRIIGEKSVRRGRNALLIIFILMLAAELFLGIARYMGLQQGELSWFSFALAVDAIGTVLVMGTLFLLCMLGFQWAWVVSIIFNGLIVADMLIAIFWIQPVQLELAASITTLAVHVLAFILLWALPGIRHYFWFKKAKRRGTLREIINAPNAAR